MLTYVGHVPAQLPNLQLDPREAVSAEVARRLIDYLFLSGEISPGQRLPSERRLAEAFGVGRSVVREALKSLTLIGMIDVRQGDGTYLKQPDSPLLGKAIEWGLMLGERKVRDLVEARQPVEVAAATLAATRRDEAALSDLDALMARMESAADPDEFVAADIAFHLRVAQASGNGVLVDVLSGIQALLQVWIRRVITAAGETKTTCREHAAVLHAIHAGDSAQAGRAMATHLEAAAARLLATLHDPHARMVAGRLLED